MDAPRFEWIRKGWLLAGLASVLAIWWFTRSPHLDDSPSVPLGVEQAAIVTYSGPAITIAPYRWGVAVNARIAAVTEREGVRVYDIRYIVNRGGSFDLKDYLASADGKPLEGLPSFKIQGDPKLSKELDARIQETEEIRVEVRGRYYATLAVLAAIWVVWLLLLIFYKRPKRPVPAAPPEPEPTTLELLRAAIDRLKASDLDAAERAKLEMLLLRRLREQKGLTDVSMYASVREIGQDEKTAEAWRELQLWLHRPGSSVQREEIAARLHPFAQPEAAPEPAVAP